jgi:S-adenosylmethionine:tRNA ribosyltransferase-isomerase
MYTIDDYKYDLPQSLIAQTPAAKRDHSRLLFLNRKHGAIAHHQFHQITTLLAPGDLLVLNDTRVIPGRLLGRKPSGGKVETLILDYGDGPSTTVSSGKQERIQRCLIKSSKKPRQGTWIHFSSDLSAEVLRWKDGIALLKFVFQKDFDLILQEIGKIPLPPYIKRDNGQTERQAKDRESYQTVYAVKPGAIAAPTAGLHFTQNVLQALTDMGVEIVTITLHVGYGTFLPVRVTDIRHHKMHTEWYTISANTAACINSARKEGRRIIAVGTTSVRTIEYHSDSNGMLTAGSGHCDLFIYPGYQFKVIDGLLTNFHLPRSTLLMLVAALAGRRSILAAYQAAVAAKYRFFSYGDAMLII